MAGQKTRKVRKQRIVATTIPELKRSFDALEVEVAKIIRSGGAMSTQVRKFQEVWRRLFGRPVAASAAEAYLQVKSRKHVGKQTRRRGAAGQKGGAAAPLLAGAPLDFQTRPGVDGVYGSYPQYVSQGLSFYNTINQEGMFKGCGIENITPKIAADMGSNQVGGGIFADAASAFFTRPVTASVPPSVGQDVQDKWLGRPLGNSPAVEDTRAAAAGAP